MPFAKGQSGNPSGRPKADLWLRDRCRLEAEKTIEKLIKLRSSKNEAIAKAACDTILGYGFGKPRQQVELRGDVQMNVWRLPEVAGSSSEWLTATKQKD